ncbi:Aste57867_25200 [Aphanomyces stellatus]|uniref:Aste57867_25200 protein n=1 Tax=Aphanomyces stellatus TaxID=120398 RepID=A0A485LSJ0_9STRA|nr:hypothetical protein As57867_025122 [Aphanomyces stellatus]VFU01827.1 Aste57867_25200 [Aphanomyces stellatus]
MAHAVEICPDTSLACDLYLYNDYDDLDAFEEELIEQLRAATANVPKGPSREPCGTPCAKRARTECPKAKAAPVAPASGGVAKEECRLRLDCSICLDAVQVPTATTCGHIYCRGCIVQSLQVCKKCPMCATKITFRNIHPLYFN